MKAGRLTGLRNAANIERGNDSGDILSVSKTCAHVAPVLVLAASACADWTGIGFGIKPCSFKIWSSIRVFDTKKCDNECAKVHLPVNWTSDESKQQIYHCVSEQELKKRWWRSE